MSRKVTDHDRFLQLIDEGKWKENDGVLSKGWNMKDKDSLAAFAKTIRNLQKDAKEHENYLRAMLEKHAPNLLAITSPRLAANLIELGGSLRRLALMPSSTIQLLGAEKALFRHIKTGARSPKHGIIVQHPLLASAKRELHGKIARTLGDRISMCVRLDFFKGEFKGEMYRKGLEKEFSR